MQNQFRVCKSCCSCNDENWFTVDTKISGSCSAHSMLFNSVDFVVHVSLLSKQLQKDPDPRSNA